jgi:hypothetical protein
VRECPAVLTAVEDALDSEFPGVFVILTDASREEAPIFDSANLPYQDWLERSYESWLTRRMDLTDADQVVAYRDLKRFWSSIQSQYENTAKWLVAQVKASDFWVRLPAQLREAGAQFRKENPGYELLARGASPDLDQKTWTSFFEKTYRINYQDNESFPRPPIKTQHRWILPDNWFTTVHDIVRTNIVVRYFDGVKRVTDAITDLALELSLPDSIGDPQGRLDGYYAMHVSVPMVLKIDREPATVHLEIQVYTQTQDALRSLTHELYVAERMRELESVGHTTGPPAWNAEDRRFVPNYLGHLLHLADGLLHREINVR